MVTGFRVNIFERLQSVRLPMVNDGLCFCHFRSKWPSPLARSLVLYAWLFRLSSPYFTFQQSNGRPNAAAKATALHCNAASARAGRVSLVPHFTYFPFPRSRILSRAHEYE